MSRTITNEKGISGLGREILTERLNLEQKIAFA